MTVYEAIGINVKVTVGEKYMRVEYTGTAPVSKNDLDFFSAYAGGVKWIGIDSYYLSFADGNFGLGSPTEYRKETTFADGKRVEFAVLSYVNDADNLVLTLKIDLDGGYMSSLTIDGKNGAD